MTPDGFRAIVRSMGLEPCRPPHDGKTLHKGREGPNDFQQVPDPEGLTPQEREDVIKLIKFLRGIRDN